MAVTRRSRNGPGTGARAMAARPTGPISGRTATAAAPRSPTMATGLAAPANHPGGDGSASVTLSAFARVYAPATLPPVALLRGGTMNTVANGCGVSRGSPDSLLSSLASRVHAGVALHSSARSTIATSR